MNKNLKLWLSVLKSGKYNLHNASTSNNLRLKKSYSIPGVAADLYIKLTGKSSWNTAGMFVETDNFEDFPITVLRWLGIDHLKNKIITNKESLQTLVNIKLPIKDTIKIIENFLKQEGLFG